MNVVGTKFKAPLAGNENGIKPILTTELKTHLMDILNTLKSLSHEGKSS